MKPMLLHLALFALAAAAPADDPLSRPVRDVSIRNETVLKALVRIGRENHVSFGIEFDGPELAQKRNVSLNGLTVDQAVRKLLGPEGGYETRAVSGVVVIRKAEQSAPDWANVRLNQYEIPRSDLAWANLSLWMALERELDPDRHGFAGDFPPGDPADLVGPFRESNKRTEELLCQIVAASEGALWINTDPLRQHDLPASVNRFWTLIPYVPGPRTH